MIETHVTSLQLSKRLCDLGVKQNSLFYWYKFEIIEEDVPTEFNKYFDENFWELLA